jgi:hypothetical protein
MYIVHTRPFRERERERERERGRHIYHTHHNEREGEREREKTYISHTPDHIFQLAAAAAPGRRG